MRARLIELLYEWSKVPYQRWFKRQPPWNITVKELLTYPQSSLGFHLGCFLLQHDFTPQPKLENHDVFHVLTNTGVSVPDEISMQFYLLGNGKRSWYLAAVILTGTLFFPDKIKTFITGYKKGKAALPFYQLEYRKLLHYPITEFKTTFLIQ